MKVKHDKDTDTLRITFTESVVEKSDEEEPGIIIDYAKDGNIIGMEILSASKKIKVIKDAAGETITVWFGNTGDEYICEEVGDGVVIMKNKNGLAIGFEYLYYGSSPEYLSIETLRTKSRSAPDFRNYIAKSSCS